MCMREGVCVCVCVCEEQLESLYEKKLTIEAQRYRGTNAGREGKRERVCVCEREKEGVCVCLCESLCVCVCEKERV